MPVLGGGGGGWRGDGGLVGFGAAFNMLTILKVDRIFSPLSPSQNGPPVGCWQWKTKPEKRSP